VCFSERTSLPPHLQDKRDFTIGLQQMGPGMDNFRSVVDLGKLAQYVLSLLLFNFMQLLVIVNLIH